MGELTDDELRRRRKWFENYCTAAQEGIRKQVRPGVRYSCPCCGYPTLSERGGYEICQLCYWEDDGQDDPRAEEVWGGPNGSYSLASARANFKRYLIMYDPSVLSARIGGTSNTAAEQDAKRAIVEAFDSMEHVTDMKQLDDLWNRIHENWSLLDRERKRKRVEYEREASLRKDSR